MKQFGTLAPVWVKSLRVNCCKDGVTMLSACCWCIFNRSQGQDDKKNQEIRVIAAVTLPSRLKARRTFLWGFRSGFSSSSFLSASECLRSLSDASFPKLPKGKICSERICLILGFMRHFPHQAPTWPDWRLRGAPPTVSRRFVWRFPALDVSAADESFSRFFLLWFSPFLPH